MKRLVTLAAGVLLGLASIDMAAAQGYIGAAAGTATPDDDEFEDSGAFRLFGGYQLSPGLAVEFGYTDAGSFDVTDAGLNTLSFLTGFNVTAASVDVSGFEFSGVFSVPVGPTVSAFGRLGMFLWDADTEVSVNGLAISDSDDGSDPFFGVGAAIALADRLTLTVEFSRYDVLDGDVDFLGIGLRSGF